MLCEWCTYPDAGDPLDPFALCDDHLAEYEGLSLEEFYRRAREQYAEEMDCK
jgi:hypothetical protein